MKNFKFLSSNFLWIFKVVWKLYSCFVMIIERFFKNSLFVEFLWRSLVSIGVSFSNSFLFRAADIKPEKNIIKESFFISGFGRFYKRLESLLSELTRQSAFRNVFTESLHEFYFTPVKTVSLLILVSVGVDTLFSLFFQRRINTGCWAFRISAVILSLSAISCGADWATVKGGSRFIHLLRKWQKGR